jgi:N-acetylglucosamine transport system permease protein
MLVFLGLPLAVYIIFVISPFAQAFYYSFTNWGGFSPTMQAVGLRNYVQLLGDSTFLKALRNNLVLLLVLPLCTLALALVLATLVTVGGSGRGQTRGVRFAGFYRVISFFPYAVPAIVIGIMWSQIFDPSSGIVNGILTGLGLHSFDSFAWLGRESTAMPVTIFVILWGFVGFYMVMFVAAIQGIEPEIFESARIDGAGRFRTAISITIPLIGGSVQTAYIYMGIFALDAFTYMQALNPQGGPNNSTLVMSQQLMDTAFTKGQFGLACAMGVLASVITMLFALLVLGVGRLIRGGRDARS